MVKRGNPRTTIELKIKASPEVRTDWSVGREMLNAFVDAGPLMAPQRIDRLTTVPKKLRVFTKVEDYQPFWRNGDFDFVFKRVRKVQYYATLKYDRLNAYYEKMPARFGMFARPDFSVDWDTLFHRLGALLRVDWGMLHYCGTEEMAIWRPHSDEDDYYAHEEYYHGRDFALGGHVYWTKKKILTNLGHTSVVRAPFMDEDKAARIAELGVHVAPLGEGWVIRLSDDLIDVKRDFAGFCEIRSKVKAIIGNRNFVVHDPPIYTRDRLP